MTVLELINILEKIPDKKNDIVFNPAYTDYVEALRDIEKGIIKDFESDGYKAYVIRSAGEIGNV